MQFKRCLMIFLVAGIFLAFLQQGYAKNYYLNANKGVDTNQGTKTSPWRTLKSLQGISLHPGDHIYFSRGSEFHGGVCINDSGTGDDPIVFTSYGRGPAPLFVNEVYNHLNGNVMQIHGSHIAIDGLHFAHTANFSGDAIISNNQNRSGPDKKILLAGAVYQVKGANYLTVKDCEFYDCPIAVYINGQHNLITKNYFHDCNRFLWKPDWGPIAIVIGNAYNEISYNRCKNYVKEGGNYGADGGFIELDSRYYGGPIHDLKIHHNYSWANEGFMEVTNAGKNLNVYYNVSDDFQQFIFFWSGDSSRVDNNTVIRTRPPNSTVNVVFAFRKNGFQFHNNIFVVADSLQVFGSGAYDARNFDQLHENNLYYSVDGTSKNPVGKPLGKDEIIANPLFINFKNNDFRLKKNSHAIGKGIGFGYKKDFENNPVPQKNPDIGAYQYQD